MAEPTHLYLIRHAEAVVNVAPIVGGMKGCRGLTAHGIAQAEALRDRLAASGEIRPDTFLASSLPRARQTAEIIAPAVGRAPVLDDDLHELRCGPEGDGLPLDEYKRRFGWVDFSAHPFREVDPGGESWARFLLRVASTLERIAREHAGKTILVVTHGGVVDGAFLHFFGLNVHRQPPVRLYTRNASITHWAQEEGDGQPRWRLVTYNDAHHLPPDLTG